MDFGQIDHIQKVQKASESNKSSHDIPADDATCRISAWCAGIGHSFAHCCDELYCCLTASFAAPPGKQVCIEDGNTYVTRLVNW